MAIEAVVFDIGDALEVNPCTGWPEQWATRLRMRVAQFEQHLEEIWDPGSVGRSTLEDIQRETAIAFNLDDSALTEVMDDAWTEYVGALNDGLARTSETRLADYFARLRPAYKTAILSNSFVGARERE